MFPSSIPGGVSELISPTTPESAKAFNLAKKEIEKRRAKENRNLSRTTPDQAAEIIVKGIKAKNPRILIGIDARLLRLDNTNFPAPFIFPLLISSAAADLEMIKVELHILKFKYF